MNNSAATRTISEVAMEYNANDKGQAVLAAENLLISDKPELQFQEMKRVAARHPKVKKWALTGYISPIKEVGDQLSDKELTDIALEALYRVGVTDLNQYRLDIHNSSKHRHIHFIVNRINIHGDCTVKAHNIGKRFGEAVRDICRERGLPTDIEIGIEKKKKMLDDLTATIQMTNSFDELAIPLK